MSLDKGQLNERSKIAIFNVICYNFTFRKPLNEYGILFANQDFSNFLDFWILEIDFYKLPASIAPLTSSTRVSVT